MIGRMPCEVYDGIDSEARKLGPRRSSWKKYEPTVLPVPMPPIMTNSCGMLLEAARKRFGMILNLDSFFVVVSGVGRLRILTFPLTGQAQAPFAKRRIAVSGQQPPAPWTQKMKSPPPFRAFVASGTRHPFGCLISSTLTCQ